MVGANINPNPPVKPDDVMPGYGYTLPLPIPEDDIYFYHTDHLGSTSYITDAEANPTQFVCYMPFGQAFVDEHTTRAEMPFKFNGKEMDSETGLYYYGARYYDPMIAVWYGVDPLAEKYPHVSPFVYCVNNPIIYIDPDGRKVTMCYAKSTAGAGSGIGASVSLYRGTAYDNYGVTHFTLTNFALPLDIENNTEPPIVLGAGGYLGGVGGSIDWKAKSFREAIDKWGFLISGGSVVVAGVGYTAKSEDSVDGINAEIGFAGFGFKMSGTGGGEIRFKESISVSYGESTIIGNRFGSFRQWFVVDEKPIFDNNGNIIGYSGTVHSNILGLPNTYKNSGIKVQCGILKDSEGNSTPDRFWTSKHYRTELLID